MAASDLNAADITAAGGATAAQLTALQYSATRQQRYVNSLLSGATARDAAKEFLQVVTTNNEIDRTAGSAATSANVKQVCRERKFIGQADVNSIILSVGSWLVPSPSSVETDGPAYTCRADLEVNGICVAATWDGGATSKSVLAGDVDIQCDAFYPSQFGMTVFPAAAEIWIKVEREYAVGAIPTYTSISAYIPPITGESTLRAATGSVSKIGTAGAMTTTGGYVSTAARYGAIAIGIPAVPIPAVGILGASIEFGSNDVNGAGDQGTGGYIRRALMSGNKVAFLHMGKSSDAAYNFIAGYAKRKKLLKYMTLVVNGYGGNDFTDNKLVADLIANIKIMSAEFRKNGAQQVYQMRLFPKTDSTDAWATLVNQTVRSNNAQNFLAYRAAFEAGITADPNTTGFIDILSVVEAAGDPGKWLVPDYTIDGTHPAPAVHGLLATPFRAALDPILAQTV